MVEQIEIRVSRLEERVVEVDRKLERFTVMIENATEIQKETKDTLNKLADVLGSVQLSMVKMQGELAANTQEILEFKGELKNVKDEAKAEEERNTIHIMDLIKKNLGYILLGILIILELAGDPEVTKNIIAFFR